MIKYLILIFVAMFLIPQNQIYASESKYTLNTDDQTFDISYSLDGQVIAMEIDHELNSLLIGITEVKDSSFQITLPENLISAENNNFVVLVNQVEVDYDVSTQGDSSVLRFFVPADSQEIEIVGTHVIPEFPLGTLAVLVTMIGIMTIVTKMGKSKIK